MRFIESWKRKCQASRQHDIERRAEDLVTIRDFDSHLYIAYQGTPLVPVKEEWTSKEIVLELSKIRQNYVNARMEECGLFKVAAAL